MCVGCSLLLVVCRCVPVFEMCCVLFVSRDLLALVNCSLVFVAFVGVLRVVYCLLCDVCCL